MKKTPFIIAAVLIIGLAGFYQFWKKQPHPQPEIALILPEPRALEKFTLIDDKDHPFTNRNLKDKWSLFFFGYTHCPDICPATLRLMQEVWSQLEKQHQTEDVQFIFVSVDPKRDTPAQLHQYMTYFNSEFIGLTGKETQIEKLSAQFGVFYMKAREGNTPENYLMEHTGSVMFVDPEGRYFANMSPPFTADNVVHDFLVIKRHY